MREARFRLEPSDALHEPRHEPGRKRSGYGFAESEAHGSRREILAGRAREKTFRGFDERTRLARKTAARGRELQGTGVLDEELGARLALELGDGLGDRRRRDAQTLGRSLGGALLGGRDEGAEELKIRERRHGGKSVRNSR